MDCEEIQRRLARGADVDTPDAQAHLRGCAACAAMRAAAPMLSPGGVVPPAGAAPSLAATMAAIAGESGPVAAMRSWSTPRRRLVGAAIAVVVPLLVAVAMPRVDHAVYPRARWFAEVCALAFATAVAVWVTVRPLHVARRLGEGAASLLGVLVVVALAALPAAHHDHPASLVGGGDDFVARALGCFAFGTVCAVPAWVALRMLAREPTLRAPAIGVAAALVGVVAVFLHCPIVLAGHLWAGHVTVLVLPALWIAWQRRPRREPAPASR